MGDTVKITSQNPHQLPRTCVKDLTEGDVFILATSAGSREPIVYVLLDKVSRHPDDGPEGHCVEFGDYPCFRSLHLSLDVVKVKMTRLDIELLPRQVG
jgi:hypothetical protein